METKVDISTKKWTGEMEDLLKIETLRHRDCILDTPPPEATTLPRNIPEAANWEGLGHARLPQVHKVGGARSEVQSIASCSVLSQDICSERWGEHFVEVVL